MSSTVPTNDLIPISSSNEPFSYATFRKNNILYELIINISIKDKRKIFTKMRTTPIPVTIDTFFPPYGFTAGEFSTWAILTSDKRK
jgi:hypothetical protein